MGTTHCGMRVLNISTLSRFLFVVPLTILFLPTDLNSPSLFTRRCILMRWSTPCHRVPPLSSLSPTVAVIVRHSGFHRVIRVPRYDSMNDENCIILKHIKQFLHLFFVFVRVQCTYFPEEQAVVQDAVKRNWGVVGLSLIRIVCHRNPLLKLIIHLFLYISYQFRRKKPQVLESERYPQHYSDSRCMAVYLRILIYSYELLIVFKEKTYSR